MSSTQFPICTISGSMRYFDVIMEVANEYTAKGYIVLIPFVTVIPPWHEVGNPVKEMLDEMHFTKIDMSELLLVVGGYIGQSTRNEMSHASERNIPVVRVRTELAETYVNRWRP